MKKVTLALIISLVSTIGLLCGCLDESSGTKVVPMDKISEYVNEKITVKGQWFDWGDTQQIGDDSVLLYVDILEGVDTSLLDTDVEYYFTGMIKYGKLHGRITDMLYLEISDIKPVK